MTLLSTHPPIEERVARLPSLRTACQYCRSQGFTGSWRWAVE